jgi:alpha-maltose-1-phosphate synthase
MSDRLRVLLIAELCNPDWISVPLEGWSHSRAIAALADSHLVTHIRNRENIARAGLVEGQDFTALAAPRMERALAVVARLLGAGQGGNKGWTTLTALAAPAYYAFEAQVWRRFGGAIRAGRFDVVHRLTPLSPTTPSLLARRCAAAGVPFVLGPLNGGLPWPSAFSHVRVKEREWLSYVRDAHKLLPGYRATRHHAAAIIVGSRATRAQMPPAYQHKCVYIPENAIDPIRFPLPAERRQARPLRVAFIGRLVPYKGADMLIEAAGPLAERGDLHVEIIGDGPERPALTALAERYRAGSRLSFPGWIPHRELQRHLADFHVFAFPSVREFGGAVVLEAMALGLVPIVLDYGGPGELVSAATGVALPMGTREEIVRALRQTLEHVVAHPGELAPIALRARARALRGFTWAAKAEQVLEVYKWVLGRRDKPDFGMPVPDVPSEESSTTSAPGFTAGRRVETGPIPPGVSPLYGRV